MTCASKFDARHHRPTRPTTAHLRHRWRASSRLLHDAHQRPYFALSRALVAEVGDGGCYPVGASNSGVVPPAFLTTCSVHRTPSQ
jgi:hypothetical protein